MAKIDSVILDEKFNEIKELFSKFPLDDSDENKMQYISMCQERLTSYRDFLGSTYGIHSDIVEKAQALCDSCYLTATLRSLDVETFLTFCTWQISEMEDWFCTHIPDGAYHLSIAAIVRDEDYLEEWIRYHLLVGVEHFYIYDNDSTNGLKQSIQKYIDSGLITYTYYPGDCVQMKAYLDVIRLHRHETKWMALIDGDEYIVPMENKPLPIIVDEIVEKYNNHEFKLPNYQVGGIGINWRSYGTSFHKTKIGGGTSSS